MTLSSTGIRRRLATSIAAATLSLAGLVVPTNQAQAVSILNTFYCSTANYRCFQINGPYNRTVGTACKFVYFQPIKGTTYTTICQRWV